MKFRNKTDDILVTTLACGGTVENAAQRAEISERSVYRRLEHPEFKQLLKDFRGELLKRTAGVLSAASIEAVKTLHSLMDRNCSPGTRLGAARSVLELSLRLRDVVDVEERLSELEKLAFEPTFKTPGVSK